MQTRKNKKERTQKFNDENHVNALNDNENIEYVIEKRPIGKRGENIPLMILKYLFYLLIMFPWLNKITRSINEYDFAPIANKLMENTLICPMCPVCVTCNTTCPNGEEKDKDNPFR